VVTNKRRTRSARATQVFKAERFFESLAQRFTAWTTQKVVAHETTASWLIGRREGLLADLHRSMLVPAAQWHARLFHFQKCIIDRKSLAAC